MGLETGWNCHISLQSESFPLDPDNVEELVTEEGERQSYALQRLMPVMTSSVLFILLNLHLLISEEEILLRDSVRERAESRAMEHDGACLIEDLNRVPLINTILTLQISIKALFRPSKKLFSLLDSG